MRFPGENVFEDDARRCENPFWAITTYYPFDDPPDDHRRRRVYREFRRRMPLPLVTVEMSREGEFDLRPADAEILIQIPEGALLWQKERLLNVALEALPDYCETVAWADCDVVLTLPDWPDQARRLLEDYALVQPFEKLYYMPPGQCPESGQPLDPPGEYTCAAKRWVEGAPPPGLFKPGGDAGRKHKCSCGMIWVARRETLGGRGLYDGMILGAGDKGIFSAACGRHREFVQAFGLHPSHSSHYLDWAQPFSDAVRGRIGFAPGALFHLWHGDLADRHYYDRYDRFERFGFDPYADIARNEYGAWRWNSEKPELHDFARWFFESRGGQM